jgi:serine/threonine-protein kinase RsbW
MMAENSGLSELKVDARLENLSKINDFVATAMKQLGIEKNLHNVQLAVDEACTNIIKHAYSGRGGMITISCEVEGSYLVITIKDRGKAFDPASVSPPDLESEIHERRVGGLGIHLMRKLMDEVHYTFDAGGNKLIMKKRLNN